LREGEIFRRRKRASERSRKRYQTVKTVKTTCLGKTCPQLPPAICEQVRVVAVLVRRRREGGKGREGEGGRKGERERERARERERGRDIRQSRPSRHRASGKTYPQLDPAIWLRVEG